MVNVMMALVAKFGRFVKSVRFECHLVPQKSILYDDGNDDDNDNDDDEDDGERGVEVGQDEQRLALPSWVTAILRDNEEVLLGVSSLSIVFVPEHDFHSIGFFNNGRDIYEEKTEDAEQVLKAEREFRCRQAITESFEAISNNTSQKSLALERLPSELHRRAADVHLHPPILRATSEVHFGW